jgi:predicted ATPase
MPDGKIVALSGTHGTGKTTAAYALAAELKRTTRAEVGIICEVARRCPLPVFAQGQATTRAAQLWIFAEQIRAEIESAQRYDLVVADRTIVDNIAYTSVAGFHDLAYGQIALARHHMSVYKRVIFHGPADLDYCADDGFRHMDHTLRIEVGLRMLEIYRELGVKLERAK